MRCRTLLLSLVLLALAPATACATVTANPGSLQFPDQLVGSAAPEQATTIKVTCTQNTTCDFEAFTTNVSISGPGDFTRSGGTCSGQIFALDSDFTGTTCTIEVTFAPVAAGARSAVLTPGSAIGPVQTVALSGSGIALPVTAPAPAPAPTPTVARKKCKKKRHRAATAKKCKKKH